MLNPARPVPVIAQEPEVAARALIDNAVVIAVMGLHGRHLPATNRTLVGRIVGSALPSVQPREFALEHELQQLDELAVQRPVALACRSDLGHPACVLVVVVTHLSQPPSTASMEMKGRAAYAAHHAWLVLFVTPRVAAARLAAPA